MTFNDFLRGVADSGFLIGALLVCLSCVYYTIVKGRVTKVQNKVFILILVNVMISVVCDLVNGMIFPYLLGNPKLTILQEINQLVYFIMHTSLSPLFCFYIALVIGANYRLPKKYYFFCELPMAISLFLILINPFCKCVYYFDEKREFVRKTGENVIYIIAILYFIAALIMLFMFWNAIDIKKQKTLLFFFVMVTLGMGIQFLAPEIYIELFMESLAITGILVTIENEDNLKNPRTGAYNELAFMRDMNTFIMSKHPFSLICLKMLNPQSLMQTVGPLNIENLTKMNVGFLNSVLPKKTIYYMNPGTFVILNENDNPSKDLEIAQMVYDRFTQPWEFQGRKTIFHAAVFYVEVPKDFKTQEQLMALISSPMMREAMPKKDGILFGKDLNYFYRRTQVERAIINGVKNRSFEVFYQPIYDARDRLIKSGEALLRLHDTVIGEIYPSEFMAVAERTGIIFELGDFVLEEVCKFLNSGIPVEMGVETLNINLSSVQCTQPGYAERIIKIVSRYGVDPGRINFEIMENAATTDFDGLEAFIQILREHGFHFSVDDYGIGYSNVHSIFSLDVDVIKIDRRILWEAEQTKIGRIIMESSTEMIKKLGKKLLISGVESKAQVDLANEFGVDYLQGFYFSNPVNQTEFIGILKATRLARIEEQRAVAANEAMSNFLANMSHEIRTPINAVLGMDEMILRESENDKIIEYARAIEGAGKTLLSLINDILDFSKIEAGNMEILEDDYELSTVINDVVNMIQVKVDQKNLELLVDVNSSTPEHLHGDEMRLRQIMVNVLNNAVKYTKEGSVSLKIGFDQSGADMINLIVSITDTGVGIREKDMAKLFGKFQRLDQNKNRTVEGSGLGLAIVHNLLELMDGSIDVESVYGEGSTFTITLPQKVVSTETVGDYKNKNAKTAPEIPKYQESFHAPEAKVLVVDDTPVNVVVVKNLLKKTQVQVEGAGSGMECLEKAAKQEYDLIFLDYRMPNMDGIETLKRLREDPNNPNLNTPVVALTANAITGARERFIKEGFDDYMTKPIDVDSLETTLLSYLPQDKIVR